MENGSNNEIVYIHLLFYVRNMPRSTADYKYKLAK